MIYHRSQPDPRPAPRPRVTHRRANPMGLGRLLIMTFTVALLSMGHGLWWWGGSALLFFILLAVSRQGHAWGTAWSSSAILLSLAFWHQGIIAVWVALIILAGGSIQFGISLLRQSPAS